MLVQATRELPNLNELIQELKNEFSARYTFKIFGLGSQKSILVRKSAWVGAQITVHGNEIIIDGSFPNIITSSYMTTIANPVNKWLELEKKITDFFKRKYN